MSTFSWNSWWSFDNFASIQYFLGNFPALYFSDFTHRNSRKGWHLVRSPFPSFAMVLAHVAALSLLPPAPPLSLSSFSPTASIWRSPAFVIWMLILWSRPCFLCSVPTVRNRQYIFFCHVFYFSNDPLSAFEEFPYTASTYVELRSNVWFSPAECYRVFLNYRRESEVSPSRVPKKTVVAARNFEYLEVVICLLLFLL